MSPIITLITEESREHSMIAEDDYYDGVVPVRKRLAGVLRESLAILAPTNEHLQNKVVLLENHCNESIRLFAAAVI